MEKSLSIAILILLIFIFGLSCFFGGYYLAQEQSQVKSIHLVNANIKRTIPILTISSLSGEGKVRDLTIEVGVGEGRALVNVNDVVAGSDWQKSARYAMTAAANYLEEDLSYVDVIFNVDLGGPGEISGASAGAAMTSALIATLNNKDLDENTLITGTISKSGKIGPVSGVLEKAKAAKRSGATLFLVPPGQSTRVPVEEETCHEEGNREICEIEYVTKDIDVEREAGIRVIEVSNIAEAMSYLLE